MPEGKGQGLVTFFRKAPEGAETFPRPTWLKGDRFVYEVAGLIKRSMRIVEADQNGYRVANEIPPHVTTRYDLDLGVMAEELPGKENEAPTPLRILDPVDARYSWPLWVGKEWVCHYVDKRPGKDAWPFLVKYHCDAIETIRVPAGEFRCLRIWRREKPAKRGNFHEWCTVSWYAPELGFLVRELWGGHEMRLVEYQKQ